MGTLVMLTSMGMLVMLESMGSLVMFMLVNWNVGPVPVRSMLTLFLFL